VSNLKRLRDITHTLPPFPKALAQSTGDQGFKSYPMEMGTCIGWNLLTQPEVSVARFFNSAGSIFPEHAHEQREHIIIYDGEAILSVKGKEVKLSRGDSIVLDSETAHSARFKVDTWYLAITIPQSPDWP